MEPCSPSMLFFLFIFLGICYLLQGIGTKKVTRKITKKVNMEKETIKKKVIAKKTSKKTSKKVIMKENPLDETIFLPPIEHRTEEMDLFPMDADLDLWGKDFSVKNFSVNGKE